MSRRRRRRRGAAEGTGSRNAPKVGRPDAAAAASSVSARARRRVWLLAIVVASAAAAFVLGWRIIRRPIVLPPPREQVTPVAMADFVGVEVCGECHVEQLATWRGSTHARAGGRPSPANVIAPFDGTPIRFRDALVRPRVRSDGTYVFEVARPSDSLITLTVDAVIGGGHMAGGGTQGFVTRRADGTWRFLPFDYSRNLRRWFCNTETRAGKGWQLITADMPLGACGDWPPVRVLGDAPRFANCQGCHAGQIDVRFDTAAGRYVTDVTTFAIGCESCHGPARRHVELARSGTLADAPDVGLAVLELTDKDASSRVCYQCHAVKDQLRAGFVAGQSLESFYSLAFPLLGDSPLHPDGRVRTFAYQESQRFSDCYVNGGMRCTDCHAPHSQGYRDVNGAPLTGRLSDGQCIGCHPSKAERVEQHTRHSPESAGSRCVACHMPYLQPPQIGPAVRYARSDHAVAIPRPAWDSTLGVASACAGCHAGERTATLATQVERWYGPLKPLPASVTAQVSGSSEPRVLLDGANAHAAARFGGLARLFERWVDGSAGRPDASARRQLRDLTDHADVDVRALALASFHWLDSDDRATRRLLADALKRAGERDAALRDRWSLALGWAGDRAAAQGNLVEAANAYSKALEVTPDHARLLLKLANAERDAGRLSDALATYARSAALDPRESLIYVNLGIALAGAGDTSGAVAAWETARRVNRFDPLPHFNLGNVQLMRGQVGQAIESYRAAMALEPGLVPTYLNLARAYAVAGMIADARRTVRAALALEGENEQARLLENQLNSLPR